MEKIERTAKDELGISRLNYPRCAKRDTAPLKHINLLLLYVFGSVVLDSNRSSATLETFVPSIRQSIKPDSLSTRFCNQIMLFICYQICYLQN